MLELERLTKTYGAITAVDRVCLRIEQGTRHGLIGANGAGKTTILNLITGVTRASSGRIVFDGRDITGRTAHARTRLGIARTFQHPTLLNRHSAIDNVVLAAARPISWRPIRSTALLRRLRHSATDLLDRVGLPEDRHNTAAGLLSHAHQRHLELAIALALKPRLLLLDEPTAGLAVADAQTLLAVLRDLPAWMTVLIIDHDVETLLGYADATTLLHAGQATVTAAPDTIRERLNTMPKPEHATRGPKLMNQHHSDSTPVLRAAGLHAGYGPVTVLHGVDLELFAGRITVVRGRNGAGKTTLIHTLIGHITPTRGHIYLDAHDITRWPTHQRIRSGIGVVAQGRRLFSTLTTAQHLAITGAAQAARDRVLERFPALQARMAHRPAQMSGGEQQMLAIARAILVRPRILLLDEPSEGLAATIIDQLANIITDLAQDGVAVLLIEHNRDLASVTTSSLVMDRGRIDQHRPTADLQH
jgi:branched-chain amino acid transport system ATP-binding protein